MRESTRPLRSGIAGAGLMGRWHAHAIRQARASVAAVADCNGGAAQRLAARHRNAEAFASIEKMIEKASLDVLHICTPLETHVRIAEQAIQAGLHVLIEKPITPGAEETERLYTLATARGVSICPVYQFLFQDGVLRALDLLPSIGRLIHIGAVFCSAGAAGQEESQMNAIAADILPHPLSLMRLFLKRDISQIQWCSQGPARGEMRIAGECNNVTMAIFISMNIRPTVCTMQLLGTEGTIHLNLFHGFAVLEPGNVSRWRKIAHPFDLAARMFAGAAINLSRRAIRRQPAYPGLQQLIERFYDCVRHEGAAPPISSADAIAVARVRDRLLRA